MEGKVCRWCKAVDPGEGHIYCEACRKLIRERVHTMRMSRMENGLCLQCGKPNPNPDREYCPECLKKAREKQKGYDRIDGVTRKQHCRRQRDSKRLANGMCTMCGENPVAPGKKKCEKCLEHLREYNRDRRMKLLSENRCIQCGRLKTGMNGHWLCDECRASNCHSQRNRVQRIKLEACQ